MYRFTFHVRNTAVKHDYGRENKSALVKLARFPKDPDSCPAMEELETSQLILLDV